MVVRALYGYTVRARHAVIACGPEGSLSCPVVVCLSLWMAGAALG